MGHRCIVRSMGPIDGLTDDDMGPLEYTALDDLDPGLLAAREAYPDFDIFRAAWGYLAVPAGSVVFMAADISGLVAKLRASGQDLRAVPRVPRTDGPQRLIRPRPRAQP